ncbi:hypothetical protein GCM10027053_51970 [Intrasporangium mesophilum]
MLSLASFFIHTVTVETYGGAGEFGDTYAAPVDVLGLLDDSVSLSRTATGDVVSSSGTAFYTHLANAPLFRPQSRVTDPYGNVMQVQAVKPRLGPSMLRALEHVEVQLR